MLKFMHTGFTALFLLLAVSAVKADIYTWTGPNGTRYYSNTAPPQNIQADHRPELPFDKEAYESRRQMEEKAMQERRSRLKADRNARLEKQLADTEAKLDELSDKTREALEIAKKTREQSKETKVKFIFPYHMIHKGTDLYDKFPYRRKSIPYPRSRDENGVKRKKRFQPAPLPPPRYEQKPFARNTSGVLSTSENQGDGKK